MGTKDDEKTFGYYAEITAGFDSSTVETGKYLIFEHSSGSAENAQVFVKGYFGGDVN